MPAEQPALLVCPASRTPAPTRRKLVTWLAAGLAGPAAAACRGTAAPATSTQTPALQRPATLHFVMHNDATEIPTFEGLTARFRERFPQVTFQIEPMPWDDYHTKLAAMVAGGTPPDCCYQASRRVISFAHAGQLVDLHTLLRRDRSVRLEDFWPGTVEENTWRGMLFGWPSDAVGVPVAFNQDLLVRSGARLPPQYRAEQRWTWDALVEIGRQVTSAETWALTIGTWDGDWPNYIYQNGGEILSKDRTECLLDRPEAYEAIQFTADLIHSLKIATPLALQGNQWPLGRLAFSLAHPNNVQAWRRELSFTWDIVPLWTRKTAGTTLFTGATSLFAASKAVDLAWEWAKFFGSREAEIERILKNGRTPALKALQEEYVRILDPSKPPAQARFYIEVLEHARPLPITPRWPEMRQIIGEELAPVYRGERPAKDAGAAIVRQVNPLLAEFKW
jgi:multiple sugar transport system substrate-binding protein